MSQIIENFKNGKRIETFEPFYQTDGYLNSLLPENEKAMWIKVFEAYYSQGDSKISNSSVTMAILNILDDLGYGIDGDGQHGEDERYNLIEGRGIDVYLLEQERQDEIVGILRNDDVLRLQFTWVIFHFGSKAALYFATMENYFLVLTEASRYVTGDMDKRENKMKLKMSMTLSAPEILEQAEKIRWELFMGSSESQIQMAKTLDILESLPQRLKQKSVDK
jgi:hypothetical protein